MLPLWIIDMGCSAASTEKLQELLSETGESLKPYWHYYHAKNKDVSDAASCKAFIDELVSDGRDCYNAFIKDGYQVPHRDDAGGFFSGGSCHPPS